MRICIITPTYLPIVGGSEMAIHELTKRLAKRRYDITLVTPNKTGAVSFEANFDIRIHRVFLPRVPYIASPLASPFVLKKILELNELENFDLLHQFHVLTQGTASILAKKFLNKPLVTSLMGADTYDPKMPYWKIFGSFISLVMNSSDAITAPSQDLANHANEQGCKKRIEIIPHGVDIEKFRSCINGQVTRENLGIKDDEIMILSLQRLSSRKRLEFVLNAIPMVVKENPNVKFVLGGSGPDREKLESMAKMLNINENVLFTGFIPAETLPALYSACDVFLLHTTYEAFGLVLAEASATGKPIISTSVGAIPEVVEDGMTGLLVRPMDSRALANAILKLSGDKNLRAEMGKAGKQNALSKYNWDNLTEKYINVYRNVIG